MSNIRKSKVSAILMIMDASNDSDNSDVVYLPVSTHLLLGALVLSVAKKTYVCPLNDVKYTGAS